MTESQEHYNYVSEIIDYVKLSYPFINPSSYCADRPDYDRPPQLYGSYIPDFYCESDGVVIIGEAKTANDIDNIHTRNQFKSYVIHRESAITNEDYETHIIYMVPNENQRQAQNILKKELAELSDPCVDVQVKSPLLLSLRDKKTNLPGIIVHREPPIEAKIEGLDYQKKAVEYIKKLEYSAIFHEQGLGKTKIAMDLLIYWLKNNIVDTVIVVTKKSLVLNWNKEFAKHSTIKPKILSRSRKLFNAFIRT